MSQRLPGDLLLRAAGPADLDQIATLLTERGEPADAVDHRLVVEDPDAGWESCAVVVAGDRVVSTATLLDETLYLGGVAIPAGQVELVATEREYEGRGLVRALMAWAHERSAERGQLLQVMIGIPFFYRQFGYEYAIPAPQTREVAAEPPPAEGFDVRPAGPADLPALARLQDAAQQSYDVRMPHSAPCWRWLAARDGSRNLVVERAGEPVGTARLTPPDEDEVLLGEVAGSVPAVHALLRYARAAAGDREFGVHERPGSPAGEALEPFLAAPPAQAARYYVRIADPVPLLERLLPVLSARLAGSGEAGAEGEVLLSFFRRHVRLPHRDGAFTGVLAGGTMQAPASAGGAGIAPDRLGDLLFGPHGLAGLAERHPDVYPGPHQALMQALFPPVRADLLTFYLP